jgi:hypothetical protein
MTAIDPWDEVSLEEQAEEARARQADRLRSAGPMAAFAADRPGREVPCRDCGKPVEVSGFALEMAETASRALARRGERPLGDGELTRCPACSRVWDERQRENALREAEEAKRLVRLVKQRGQILPAEESWLRRRGFAATALGLKEALARNLRKRLPGGEV